MNDRNVLMENSLPQVSVHYSSKGTLRRELPSAESMWLSRRECLFLSEFRDASRREEWLLGRWLLKNMLASLAKASSCLHDLRRIEILPQKHNSLSTRPLLMFDGESTNFAVSLSHSDCGVLAGIADPLELNMGVDLVEERPVRDGFLKLWFTRNEQDFLRTRRDLAMRFWGAKEASYKAIQKGERFVPTAFEVGVSDNDWHCYCRESNRACRIDVTSVGLSVSAIIATAHCASSRFNFRENTGRRASCCFSGTRPLFV